MGKKMSISSPLDWAKKSKFAGRFDVVYLNNQLGGLLKEETKVGSAPRSAARPGTNAARPGQELGSSCWLSS